MLANIIKRVTAGQEAIANQCRVDPIMPNRFRFNV
jgi:hypothetical protein